MRFSLSTNWCNRRIDDGAEIAEKALSLGFEELELGYNTTDTQIPGFRRMLDRIPVGSVHAFCPVPISAPCGYPELYHLADFDAETRAMARLQVRRNLAFAAEIGAKTLVLHAGRVPCSGFLKRWNGKRREKRGRKLLEVFRVELETLAPELEKAGVVLALENLPYLEGFPNEAEMTAILGWGLGEWVRPWFDTGHDYVRRLKGWIPDGTPYGPAGAAPVGLHINDCLTGDDHLAPGRGKVDFAALGDLARVARHIVFEPCESVTEEELRDGLVHLENLWKGTST